MVLDVDCCPTAITAEDNNHFPETHSVPTPYLDESAQAGTFADLYPNAIWRLTTLFCIRSRESDRRRTLPGASFTGGNSTANFEAGEDGLV